VTRSSVCGAPFEDDRRGLDSDAGILAPQLRTSPELSALIQALARFAVRQTSVAAAVDVSSQNKIADENG